MTKFKAQSKASADLIISKETIQRLGVGGHFLYECFDKEGKLKWAEKSKNTVTNQGMQYILDALFGVVSLVTDWYVGIYTATVGSFIDLTGADIGGSNLTEFTSYTGSRKQYIGARTGVIWTNTAAKAEFSIANNATIKGSFLASDDAGTATYLLAIDAFSTGDRAVAPGDTLRVTYEFGTTNV